MTPLEILLAPPVRPSTEWLRKRIERRHKVTFWGVDYFVTPLLVNDVFGDGQALLWIEPLNTRPNYYVVRIDSSWVGDTLRDHFSEIYESIEDQYGFGDSEDDGGIEQQSQPWPAFDDSVGVSWGNYTWPDPFEDHPRLFTRRGNPTRLARARRAR